MSEKTNYILVDTWNGEGYSESSAEVIQADNYLAAVEVAKQKAIEASGDNGTVRIFNKNTACYDIDDDNGAYHIENFEDQYGICIMPDTNQYQIIGSRVSYLRAIELSIKEAEDKDGWEVEELNENEQGQLHTSKGCEVFQKLNEDTELEFYEGGDGVEYEIWQNPHTKQLYRMPIEVVRDYDNKEAVDSCYEAKVGKSNH